jgi:hypothetical protein
MTAVVFFRHCVTRISWWWIRKSLQRKLQKFEWCSRNRGWKLGLVQSFEAIDVAYFSIMTSVAVTDLIHTGGFLFV